MGEGEREKLGEERGSRKEREDWEKERKKIGRRKGRRLGEGKKEDWEKEGKREETVCV